MSKKLTKTEILEIAKKFTNKSDFLDFGGGAYKAAKNMGIFEEATSHMPKNILSITEPHNKKWNEETLQKESAKYKNRYEFKKNNTPAFNAAKKLQLLDILYPIKGEFRNEPYSLEEIIDIVKQFKTKTELKKAYPYLYRYINKLNLINKVMPNVPENAAIGCVPRNKKWNEETIKLEALKYNARHDFAKNSSGAYKAANDMNVLDLICSHMKRSVNTSSPEQQLFNIVKEKFPKAQKLRIRNKNLIPNKPHIKGFDIDIYIPELRKGIEFDGKYWHSKKGLLRSRDHWPNKDVENYHNIKDEYFASKGIKLLHINEKDWYQDKDICVDKIENFLRV